MEDSAEGVRQPLLPPPSAAPAAPSQAHGTRPNARVVVFAVLMLVTGTTNTIALKFQDRTVVGQAPDGSLLYFQHPGFQTACMFLGEALCLVAYIVHKGLKRRYQSKPQQSRPANTLPKVLTFALPTICDASATTLMNVGLFFTYASVYQMLRGTLVLFTGFWTVTLLHRHLRPHHWTGIALVTTGAAVVGAASLLASREVPPVPSHNHNQVLSVPSPQTAALLGNLFVVMAQALGGLQVVLEEKFLAKYHVPSMQAVGIEGFWGVLISLIALPILYFVRGQDQGSLESFPEALRQVYASRRLQVAVPLSIISVAFFNYFGISVTKSLSGAARATIDACRTLFIWMTALAIGWEMFHGLQVVGFAILLLGTLLYNEIVKPPVFDYAVPPGHEPEEYAEPLIVEEEHTATYVAGHV
eukprot:jgi/Chlat1/8878/Chrsp92S08195